MGAGPGLPSPASCHGEAHCRHIDVAPSGKGKISPNVATGAQKKPLNPNTTSTKNATIPATCQPLTRDVAARA